MSDLLAQLKQGNIPQLLVDQIGAPNMEAHKRHIAFLDGSATYNVFGNEFSVAPGLYHPSPWSSSVFVIRSLLRERPAMGRLLELGCGTGAISLSLIQQGLADSAVMTVVSADAIQVTEKNASNLGLQERIELRQGSMFAPVAGEKFDSVLFSMPLQHAAHEGIRHIALDDPQGELAVAFFEQVCAYLAPGGHGYFCFSNISDPTLLRAFAARAALSLVAAEWVISTGFWLLLYRCRDRV
jgi:methylase of polypeptide subunit release factors